jgi:hypothetical protein
MRSRRRLLDHEAFGGLDVFKVDAAKAGLHQRDRLDQRLGVFAVDLDVDRIDIGKALEQHRLAFHHRLGGQRAQIAQAQNGRAVRDHRHQVALGGIFIGGGRVGDRFHRHGNAGRIGKAEVALGGHRLAGHDLDFAGAHRGMVEQGLALGKTDVAFLGHRFFSLSREWGWVCPRPNQFARVAIGESCGQCHSMPLISSLPVLR